MSASAVVWIVVALGVIALLGFAAAQLAAASREARRLKRRLAAYRDLPLVAALHGAEPNLHRLDGALSRIEPLVTRATLALDRIREGPVPPGAVSALRRITVSVAAFRAATRR